mmetsp:Transcript_12762/g.26877  ORF Transcript_12762/g.26877 Transcript_12762/m.26877 type:complete len:235 (-) Transcript_12762:626-1330(-)
MLCFLQVVLLGVPLFFIVAENSIARFFLISSMVFIMSMSVLLLMSIPTFIRLRQASNNNGRKKSTVTIGGVNEQQIMSSSRANIFQDADKAIKARISYEEAWGQRVVELKDILEEAGIDAKLYLRKANIFNSKNNIVPIESATSTREFIGRIYHRTHIFPDSKSLPIRFTSSVDSLRSRSKKPSPRVKCVSKPMQANPYSESSKESQSTPFKAMQTITKGVYLLFLSNSIRDNK